MPSVAQLSYVTAAEALLLTLLLLLVRRAHGRNYVSVAATSVFIVSVAFVFLAAVPSAAGAYAAALSFVTGSAFFFLAVFELLFHRPPARRYLLMTGGLTGMAAAAAVGVALTTDAVGETLALVQGIPALFFGALGLMTVRNLRGDRRLSLALLACTTFALATAHAIHAAATYFSPAFDFTPLLVAPYIVSGLVLLFAIFEDEREAAALAASQVELLAYYDSLTGLPNRSLFFDRAVLALSQAERYEHRAAVLFLDLDRFKTINDSLGHHVGDLVLKNVAERLQNILRLGDTVSRFGGDEYTILLPRVDSDDDAVMVARKVIKAMREPIKIGSRELAVTSSVGIAFFAEDGLDPNSLITNADTAMYRAKEKGGDQYELYSPALSETALARLELEIRLRRALEKGELELHYHPLIRLKDHSIFGVEALLRWKSEEFGYISPERFIAAAEVSGLIIEIGEWVIREACRQVSRWQLELQMQLTVCVNLSPRQFAQPDLLLKIQRALSEAQLAPSSLEIEITESSAMVDVDMTIAILRGLKSIGVQVAIDDFGTGYSSLSSLQKFPIDTLKLDRSFVSQSDRAEPAAIIKGIINIAHGLRMKVIAEGVETEEQLSFLKEHYCDIVQGYLFAEPLHATDFSTFVKQHRELVTPVGATSSWLVQSQQPEGQRYALVVDDDPTIRGLVQRILLRAKFMVDVARDGEEALELLRKRAYSAVFLDLMMPNVDGYAVIEALKLESPETLRNVVVMTAVAPAALERIAGEPIARILPKPFDINQVIASANDVSMRQRAS